jgi:hypothetical protein
MRLGWVGVLAGIGGALLALQGCVPTAVVVDQALEGRAEKARTFAGEPDEVYAATMAALRQSGAEVHKAVRDNLGADIDGNWPTRDKFEVRLDRSGERQTSVRVQIGRYGNREATERLFTAIAKNLHPRSGN